MLTAKDEASTDDGCHRTNVFRLCLELYVRTFTDNLSRHIVGKTVGESSKYIICQLSLRGL